MTGDPREFKDQVVLITGGGSGVGYECAKLFLSHGANVMLVGRGEDKLKTAAQDLGGSIDFLAGNVADSEVASAAFDKAAQSFGRPVDILINNAGTILRRTAEDTSDVEWMGVMAVNVDGVFYFSREFARRNTSSGAIVNISSTCGQVGAAGLAAYCASKGAVDQLTRAMALELAPRRINVNAVAPGAINSPMLFSKHADPKDAETVVERNLASIPIGTVAEPHEIARAVLFLARERHITGTILSVDGGYTAL